MGAKAIYTDLRNKLINSIVLANDVEALAGLLRDREEFYKFVSGWKRVNLDEYIEKFVGEHSITSDNFNATHNLRKISFWDDGKYTDSKGNYHGKEYVNLDLKSPSIPGTFQGKARKAELNRLTHFAMTYKKGTV